MPFYGSQSGNMRPVETWLTHVSRAWQPLYVSRTWPPSHFSRVSPATCFSAVSRAWHWLPVFVSNWSLGWYTFFIGLLAFVLIGQDAITSESLHWQLSENSRHRELLHQFIETCKKHSLFTWFSVSFFSVISLSILPCRVVCNTHKKNNRSQRDGSTTCAKPNS